MTIRKAIIPAAGLGTRFLPATKAQPKEMLPIVDKPTIQYIVEEAIDSGIEDIIIVTGRGKRAIEDHFDLSLELEDALLQKNNFKMAKELRSISELANIHYIRQKEPKGLGHAIWCARKFIGNEPFAVLLGDDIVQAEVPCLRQLMDVFNKHSCSVLGVQEVPKKDVSKYGIVSPGRQMDDQKSVAVQTLIEKPKESEAPSTLAIMGRYILTPEIFKILDEIEPGSGGEIQLTDAIKELNDMQPVLAYAFEGTRYDVGDKFGFIKATIEFALQRDDLKGQLKRYFSELVEAETLSTLAGRK